MMRGMMGQGQSGMMGTRDDALTEPTVDRKHYKTENEVDPLRLRPHPYEGG